MADPGLPPGYADPDAYLVQAKFHLTQSFTPSFLADLVGFPRVHRVSYSLVGASDEHSAPPTIVLLNGMGGHRLSTFLFDGLFASRGVRLLTLDRPGCGASTAVPLNVRVQWTTEALLSILQHHSISNFTLWSHSNGVLYALPFLLALPLTIVCTHWCLTSPFVPPWLSSSLPLQLARYIPAGATAQFGSLVKVGVSVAGPLMRGIGWSTGLSGSSMWASTFLGSPPPTSVTPLTPQLERAQYLARTALLPFASRQFGRVYYSAQCVDLAQSFVLAEGFEAYGDEALLSLRKGCGWGWPDDDWNDDDDDGSEYDLYTKNFALLRGKIKMRVWYGEKDGLIPEKGREYVRSLWSRLELLDEKAPSGGWKVDDGLGHDEVLAYETVMNGIADVAFIQVA